MQNVNQQIHWALNRSEDFPIADGDGLRWNQTCRAVTLAPEAFVQPDRVALATLRDLSARPALLADRYETWARVAPETPNRLVGGGVDVGTETLLALPEGQVIRDMDSSAEGDLFVVSREGSTSRLHWADTLGRFDPLTLSTPGFRPDRVAVAPDQSDVWVLGRGTDGFAKVKGTALPGPIAAMQNPGGTFQADPKAPDLPRLERLELAWPGMDRVLDMTALGGGRAVVLCERADSASDSRVFWISADGTVHETTLQGVSSAFTMAPYGTDGIVVSSPGWTEARVYHWPLVQSDAVQHLRPSGQRIPLLGWSGERLGRGAMTPAVYPIGTGTTKPWARLRSLSTASYAKTGAIRLDDIDTAVEDFGWHRIYLEADIPKGTRLVVSLAAHDGTGSDDGLVWADHVFGPGFSDGTTPVGTWLHQPSEHAHHRCHLPKDVMPEPNRRGLWTCLIQGPAGPSRRMDGRILSLRLRMIGTGGATPELYALRVWGPRFSYRDQYLPELYAISEGPGAEGSDFLDRFLGLFESFLTPLEGEIAQTWRGASAASAPPETLDWLATWLGLKADPALGETGKRRLIAGAAEQSLWHGTLRGLEEALDIATDGGVRASRVVVLENFKIQRTIATILGADFDDTFDPLTRGTRRNAHSHLGSDFVLGKSDERAFFALFRPELLDDPLTTPQERAAALADLQDMEEATAFKVTILVHADTPEFERGLIRAVLDREIPAHVQAEMFDAPQSLLLGLTALLGVETRLGPPIAQEPLRLGATPLGQAWMQDLPALDPRLEP